MGLQQFIEKRLMAVSKKIHKGDIWEKEVSKHYHQKFVPVLISPEFLRSFGAGQIDVCVFDKLLNIFTIYECKSGGFINNSQKSRLKKSATLISSIFNRSVTLKVCQNKAD